MHFLLLAILISWTDPNTTELGTSIEKTISGNCTTGFFEIGRVGMNMTSWADDLGQPGDCYRVRVFNASSSAYSNTAQIPLVPPPPPKCNPKAKKCK